MDLLGAYAPSDDDESSSSGDAPSAHLAHPAAGRKRSRSDDVDRVSPRRRRPSGDVSSPSQRRSAALPRALAAAPFAHPVHLALPVPPEAHAVLSDALSRLDGDGWQCLPVDEAHVSLARPFSLHAASQGEALRDDLRAALRAAADDLRGDLGAARGADGQKSLHLSLSASEIVYLPGEGRGDVPAAAAGEEAAIGGEGEEEEHAGVRTFAALAVLEGADAVVRVIETIDGVLARHGLPTYYRPAVAHVSIAHRVGPAPASATGSGTDGHEDGEDAHGRVRATASDFFGLVPPPPQATPSPDSSCHVSFSVSAIRMHVHGQWHRLPLG